jgi:hypothetical protein
MAVSCNFQGFKRIVEHVLKPQNVCLVLTGKHRCLVKLLRQMLHEKFESEFSNLSELSSFFVFRKDSFVKVFSRDLDTT